tara:strand:- start:22241 stop:22630 length:390 start_codon:yes stop_codon:yes gene_type:complete
MAKKRYSDLDLDFIPHPVSGDVPFKYDAEAIKRSVRNLVFMGRYEKPFHPEIRSEVRRLLFENFTPIIKFEIEREIEDIITQYEPRAEVEEIEAIDDTDNNSLNVTVRFTVVGVPNELIELTTPIKRIR